MAQQGGIVPTFRMFKHKPFRESMSIPDRIWNELEPMIKDKIIAIRANLRKKNEEAAKKSNQAIPNQYCTMVPKEDIKKTMLNLVSSMEDFNLATEDEYDTDDDFCHVSSAMMVRVSVDPPEGNPDTDIEVRAHFEYTSIPELKSKFYAISDSGADSCVLGNMAKVLTYTGRYASLIGYDPANTKSERVPIVTALIKARSSSNMNYEVLLKINEAPLNKGSPITLLSEYQIREHGLVIDSVARKHRSIHGKSGTQCFCVNSEVFIDFEDRGGLMGFELLPVEDGDEDKFDVITITSPLRWTPRKFKDEPFDGYFYDPTDVHEEAQGYPALVNHLSQEIAPGDIDLKVVEKVVSEISSAPMIETQVLATTSWHRVIHEEIDPMYIRPFLGYRPVSVVKATLEKTTQMAKMIIRTPMSRHIKARNPHMNVTRIDETVSTDPLFANCKSISHGYTAAQIFFGIKSHTIFVYGIRSKAEFPNVYRDFIRAHGAPSALRRDNAQEEKGEQVIDINREYMIKDEYTEPYHPQQNPVETSAIRYLKNQVQVLLDTTGAPDTAWYLAVQYIADVHNICSDINLPDKMTPMQYKTGVTPDISVFLQFTFWQPILYLDHESVWPSSKERAGRWVGVAHNIGDTLTYWILDDQTKQVLARSVVRPFCQNHRVKWDSSLINWDNKKHTATHAGDV
ncbi:MAG TPA: hypothetical protein VE944_09245, partial [Nostoc sp.]|uniref:hypothetical protein n=1 Tax=Nostoc sp. TaxID=1180 RepID=UPI002D3E8CC4